VQQASAAQAAQPAAGGVRQPQAWVERHKLTGLVQSQLNGRTSWLKGEEKNIAGALESAGCHVVTTDVPKQSMSAQEVHDGYLKSGHVFESMLARNLSRQMERRLREKSEANSGSIGREPTDPVVRRPRACRASNCTDARRLSRHLWPLQERDPPPSRRPWRPSFRRRAGPTPGPGPRVRRQARSKSQVRAPAH